MSKASDTITVLQVTMIIITYVGIVDHVIVVPLLLQSAGRDAWIAALLAGGALLLWLPLLFYIMKHTGQQNLYLWLSQHWGRTVALIITLIVVTELFISTLVTIRDVTSWTNITYLPATPNWILTAIMLAVSLYAAYSGLRTIAIVNGILLPLVVALGFFVTIVNIPRKDYTLLFPIMENGIEPVLKGVLYAGGGFMTVIILLLLQHRLERPLGLFSLVILGLILINLTVSPLTGAIAAFGPFEAARQRFPAYEQWRLVTFGHYIEQVDFLSIYQWLVGSFTRLAIGLYVIPDIIHVTKRKHRLWILIFIAGLLAIFSQIPISDMVFMQFLKKVYFPIIVITVLALTIVIGVLVWIKSRKKGVA